MTVPTAGIVNVNDHRSFLVQWRNGWIVLRDGVSGDVIMEWTDANPFPITHFGVRSPYGARGNWRITHFYGSGAGGGGVQSR